MGWSGKSADWTNVIDSHIAIFLLCKGWTVEQICNTIGYGWSLKHIIMKTKFCYYGDGDLIIKK
jgi:hypothetical protein